MDLEECILVRKCLFQVSLSWTHSRLEVREDYSDISCPQVTDNTLVQLSIHCPRLQALVNNYRANFFFFFFGFLQTPKCTGSHLLPSLSSFLLQSLSHCELITDDGIRALSSSTCGQERLTVVELDNCPLITDVTLEHLKSCHRLERIELYDCQQVTRAGIKRIRVSGRTLFF